MRLDVDRGFQEDELHELCMGGRKLLRPWRRQAVVGDWTTNIYSLGYTFRQALHWPNSVPLPFSTDHGMQLNQRLDKNEVSSPWRVHLSWCEERAIVNEGNPLKEVLRVGHPWVTYRRKARYSPRTNRSGVLMFATHSHPWSNYDDFDWAESVDRCKEQLSSRGLQLRAVCVHQHDVAKGIAQMFRGFGLPVVTVGNTQSTLFVDRFYDLMTHFEAGVSARPGIESMYFVEMGVPFYALERTPPELTRVGELASINGRENRLDQLGQQLEEKFLRIFHIESTSTWEDKAEVSRSFLSTDLVSDPDWTQLAKRLRNQIMFEKATVAKRYFDTLGSIGRLVNRRRRLTDS